LNKKNVGQALFCPLVIDWIVRSLWFAIGRSYVSDRLIPPSCQ